MSIEYTPRTETVIILQGEDEEQLRYLRAYAETLKPKAKPAANATLDEGSQTSYDEAVAAADAFAEEAQGRGIHVVMRSLGRKKWRELIAKHPARDGNESDQNMGVNSDTFGEEIVPACMASPVFDSDAERDAFLFEHLSEAQFGQLEVTAWALNTRTGADPKARLGSKPTPT